jgi:hypothetical protein
MRLSLAKIRLVVAFDVQFPNDSFVVVVHFLQCILLVEESNYCLLCRLRQ